MPAQPGWEVNKVRNRVFDVKHLASGRTFQIRGSISGSHRFEAFEYQSDGKKTPGLKLTSTGVVNWQSMRLMLETTLPEYIVQTSPGYKPRNISKPTPYNWQPQVLIDGQMRTVWMRLHEAEGGRYAFNFPLNRDLVFTSRSDGWHCGTVNPAEKVCEGQKTIGDALLVAEKWLQLAATQFFYQSGMGVIVVKPTWDRQFLVDMWWEGLEFESSELVSGEVVVPAIQSLLRACIRLKRTRIRLLAPPELGLDLKTIGIGTAPEYEEEAI